MCNENAQNSATPSNEIEFSKMRLESPDLAAQNIAKIGELFPNCITESRDDNGHLKKAINFDLLKQMLSDSLVKGSEAYEFTWVGKKASIVEANRPIRKTLRPCPEESVDWDKTENLYIEGDNLEVLKLLQESYLGKVKMIYIDPPYNTGSDFVYRDDFKIKSKEWSVESGEVDAAGQRLVKNIDSNGRFHSDWCSMIYSRLLLARNLLSDDGVIFISIDDCEVQNMRNMSDEIFGRENFISEFPRVTKRGGKSTATFAKNHDYVLAYCKNSAGITISGIAHIDSGFKNKDEYFEQRGPYKLNQTLDYNTLQYNTTMDFPIVVDGVTYVPGGDPEQQKLRHAGQHGIHDWVWRWSPQKFDFGYKNGWVVISKSGRIYTKTYLNATIDKDDNGKYSIVYYNRTKAISTLDLTENKYSNDNSAKEFQSLMGKSLFEYVKPSSLIELFLTTCTAKDSLILDFFSGSATTAQAVMQLNADDGGKRKFIMVQLPETCAPKSEARKAGYANICEIGKERIRRAGQKIKDENPMIAAQLDTGFRVFKIADSNMKDVYYSAASYTQALLPNLESNVKADRNALDLLFGCLLEWGMPLSLPYFSENLEGAIVHTYGLSKEKAEAKLSGANAGARIPLIACFEENVHESVIQAIAKRQPWRAVFRDSTFANSQAKINALEIFKCYAPTSRVKII